MRLLRLSDVGELSLTKHDDDKLPPYAVLSHTWGDDEDELTLSDVEAGHGKSKAGYAKVLFCGRKAQEQHIKDFWVDSCCIKKDSDAELSEAINSMFRWYRQAARCYVYLSDVSALKRNSDNEPLCNWEAAFRKSRWFTRGWTLQELLAPQAVEFWSRDGRLLGTKDTLKDLISQITKVPLRALAGAPLAGFNPNERLRWAAKRETKRKEDKAYSLFGIFDLSLSLMYGEGDKAFVRLRHEIDRTWNPTCSASITSEADGMYDLASSSLLDSARQERRNDLLASLNFDQIDARYATIKKAQRTTCAWVLAHPAYIAWNNRDRSPQQQGILWIAGKPGAGKSTLVKFALAHAKKSKLEGEIILSFFFNARGDDMEKTTLGMYRGLLIQLLNDAPDLQCVLDRVGASEMIRSSLWTLDLLQELLAAAVRGLEQRRLKLFIDALDECDEQQIRDMVEFLEDLAEEVLDDNSRISICFASRHYPTINIREGWRLVLEDEVGHAEDLRKYIHRRLQIGKRKSMDEVRAKVQEKANGVFMWVVLVIDTLNKEFCRGSVFAVKQRLEEIPSRLSDLFKDLLRRDCVRMDDLLLCIQWVLFAKRPLRREEFYFAMEAGLHHDLDCNDNWTPEPWDPAETTIDDMNRFVLNSSKGLAELTKSKSCPTVQFIHESVRDFLLKDGGLRELWPELEGHFVSSSHDKLKKCCSESLAANLSDYWDPARALPKGSSAEAKTLRQQVSDAFPFLEYASKEVLYHSNEAAQAISQEAFLGAFALDKWIHVTNLFKIHDIRRHSPQANIPYVLAEKNCARLVRALRYDTLWLRLPDERYQFSVLAAFANGHQATLQAFLADSGAAFTDNIAKDPGFGKPAQVRRCQEPLQWATENDNWYFAVCLLGSYASNGSSLSNIRSSEVLQTALIVASTNGHEKMVRLLLDKGADVDATTGWNNALYAASSNGHETVVQLLLDNGANVNAHSGYFSLALQAASHWGHEKVVQMLLDAGADVNAQGGAYGTALQAASLRGHDRVVQMLLNAGAEVNARGGHFGNALQAASYEGHEKVVQMLLHVGADVNAQGGEYGNALQAASSRGCEKVVQMLLDMDAEINAQGGYFGNALQAALSRGREKVVQMLLDAGAKVSVREGHYGNALKAASMRGHKKVAEMLLDGAAVSSSS